MNLVVVANEFKEDIPADNWDMNTIVICLIQ